MEESAEVSDDPISSIFAGMIMTALINDLTGKEDAKSQEKMIKLFEALMTNGGEVVIVSVLVKVIELMSDRIMEHNDFDVAVYCKQ